MADEREEIRRRVDIVSLVGQRVALVKRGKTWKGLCPFHTDKNPSFDVNAELGRYRCWSCGEAGDVFTWVMKTQNVEFAEALQLLAKIAGIELKGANPHQRSERQHQRSAMEDALTFFREQFLKSDPARAYCTGRGIRKEVIDQWEMGYAPDLGEALVVHLRKKGYALPECKSLFLVDENARGGYYDKFRGRLIFPIRDERGELVAFGGRLLDQGHPKYINSSDTPLYRKSRVLYGMHVARERMSKVRTAVLVEGYLDVIACHSAGVNTAVASLGTALSEEHAKLLKRWVDEVVILYDADAAGQKAAERAIDILKAEGLRTRVALMPAGEDPDTLLRSQGPDAVQAAVNAAVSPLEYHLQSLRRRLSPKDEAFWSEAVAFLAEAPTTMELERYLVPLAAEYPEIQDPLQAQRALRKWVTQVQRTLRRSVTTPKQAAAEYVVASTSLAAPEIVLFRALLDEDLCPLVWRMLGQEDLFVTGFGASLAHAVYAAFPTQAPQGEAKAWLHQVEPESVRKVLGDLVYDIRAERILARQEETSMNEMQLREAYVADVVRELLRLRNERELGRLTRDSANRDSQDLHRKLRELKGLPPEEAQADPWA
ncbi:MAG: DNA primase [Fimbriimonas sp.]